ncbi:MAG: ribonuclease H-like domain-containing protein [Candidatus Hydrogenedens sp.]
MKKDISLNKLAEKLGLIKASQLHTTEEISERRNPNSSNPSPSSNSSPELSKIQGTSSLLQRLRERLGITSVTSYPTEKHPARTYKKSIGGTLIDCKTSQCLYFSEIYPHPYTYGEVLLSDALHFSVHEAKISSAGNEIAEFNPEKALFIDTETTSCFGGTGTVAFLVGIGYFVGKDFHLEQFFMRDYDDEPALLTALDKRIQNASLFIGYNSKCFDLPLLRNRYRMNRLPFHGETLSHFDLMHVARRFWNRRLSDCSLNTVERFILNIRRQGDVPSSLIPRLWLNYINTGQSHGIPRILEHNQKDILSLAGLMAWIAQRVQIPKGQGFEEIMDRCALIRLQMKCGHYSDVIETAEDLLQQTDYPPIRTECLKILSEVYRKLQKTEEREQTLILWAKEEKESVFPRIELAKFYEHHQKQWDHALYWTEQALEIEPKNTQIIKRRERLLRKMNSAQNLEYLD